MFAWAYSSRRFSLWFLGPIQLGRTFWWQGYVVEELHHLMTDRKQRVKKTPGTSHLLLSIEPYFLKFPEPSKIGPPAGDQVLWGAFYIHPVT